jgi:TolA-binding protein
MTPTSSSAGTSIEALAKLGDKEQALKRLEAFNNYKLLNPKLERDLMEAYKLNATIQIDAGNFSAAEPALEEMSKSKDDDMASFAITRKGDLAYKQDAKRDAVLLYLQTALLFPKSPSRPEALLKAANTLKELKDPRSVRFADMLKADYANDPLVKQLK